MTLHTYQQVLYKYKFLPACYEHVASRTCLNEKHKQNEKCGAKKKTTQAAAAATTTTNPNKLTCWGLWNKRRPQQLLSNVNAIETSCCVNE